MPVRSCSRRFPSATTRSVVALEGFKAAEFTDVNVAVGQEYSLTAKLSIGAQTEVVTVTAGASLVTTTTPEVTSTIVQRQVLDIPLAGRDVTNLINLQAGVTGVTTRANTVDQRRPPDLDPGDARRHQHPGQLHPHQFARLPARTGRPPTTSRSSRSRARCAGADAAGGATAVRMVTPSGTNRFTGSVFEFNRDNKFAANSFFNNAVGTAEGGVEAESVRRPRRRADPPRQAVLLLHLRGAAADAAAGVGPDDPGDARTSPMACSAMSICPATSGP